MGLEKFSFVKYTSIGEVQKILHFKKLFFLIEIYSHKVSDKAKKMGAQNSKTYNKEMCWKYEKK